MSIYGVCWVSVFLCDIRNSPHYVDVYGTYRAWWRRDASRALLVIAYSFPPARHDLDMDGETFDSFLSSPTSASWYEEIQLKGRKNIVDLVLFTQSLSWYGVL